MEYVNCFIQDFLLFFGCLWEWFSVYECVDVIIVSKCFENLSEVEKQEICEEIDLLFYQ